MKPHLAREGCVPEAATRRAVNAKARGQLSGGHKLLLLALNLVPLAHAAGTASLWWLPVSIPARLGLMAGVLYLVPPVVARLLLAFFPVRASAIPLQSAGFFTWWALLQLQVLFNRWPALEEWLRIVPGLYSSWLRLWGARIGKLTYWAPGVRILDRSFLVLGDEVVFGAGVRLNAHVISGQELLLAPIRIGHRATIGGYSLLTAGTIIAEDETVRACLLSPPFSEWRDGKRVGKRMKREGQPAGHGSHDE